MGNYISWITTTNQKENIMAHYKIYIIGDPNTGKSSIIERFNNNRFKNKYTSTINLEITQKVISFSNDRQKRNIHLQIYEFITDYSVKPTIIFFVYDVTKKESFINIYNYYKEIEQRHDMKYILCCLIGNKMDLHKLRQVSTEEGRHMAELLNMHFHEVSVKDNKEYINGIVINRNIGCLFNYYSQEGIVMGYE